LHNSVAGIDVEFLRRIRRARRGLHFGHAICQDLPDAILLRAKRARVQTILHRASESKHTDREYRETEQHFIKRESELASVRIPLSSGFTSSHSLPIRRGQSAANNSRSTFRPGPRSKPWLVRTFRLA